MPGSADPHASSIEAVVVVPTYNEAENLPLLVPKILEQDPRLHVLVVDDGSPDGTGRIAGDMALECERVHALNRSGPRGLGYAYREGLSRALAMQPELVLQMDADFSHPPEALPEMLHSIQECDVVLGSRYLDGITVVNWPIERILLSYYGNLYVRIVTGMPIRDTTGGFRCLRAGVLRRCGFERIRSQGYAFQIELNYRLHRLGARIRELPFFFLDRTRGRSKLSWRIGLEAIWVAPRLRLADLLRRL